MEKLTNQKILSKIVSIDTKTHYEEFALSNATKILYDKAWKCFKRWVATSGYTITDSPEMLIKFFCDDMASNNRLKYASISSYIQGIKHHYMQQFKMKVDLADSSLKATLKGIRRTIGVRQNQKKPLLVDDIKQAVDAIEDTLIGQRDKALLLMGFLGAFRRSELVGLMVEDLEIDGDGMKVLLRRSKTDQDGEGRYVDIPWKYPTKYCAISALNQWIEKANINSGFIFRRVSAGDFPVIFDNAITPGVVAKIIKKRCGAFKNAEDLAGHSLRAGHVTSAVKQGITESKIMRQTGHKNFNTFLKYERMVGEFVANSANELKF